VCIHQPGRKEQPQPIKQKKEELPQMENELRQRWGHDTMVSNYSHHPKFMLAQRRNPFKHLQYSPFLHLHPPLIHISLLATFSKGPWRVVLGKYTKSH
jgi:hypothetical protein